MFRAAFERGNACGQNAFACKEVRSESCSVNRPDLLASLANLCCLDERIDRAELKALPFGRYGLPGETLIVMRGDDVLPGLFGVLRIGRRHSRLQRNLGHASLERHEAGNSEYCSPDTGSENRIHWGMSYKLCRQYLKVEAHVSNQTGALYVVATPIGNLEDMSPRAIRALSQADLIAAEDTRHSTPMLRHFGIERPVMAFHEHNERTKLHQLLRRLDDGQNVALVSDAGTPLVSDPGFHLVRAARAAGIPVVPVPGPCAAIVALSASGLPSDRFAFEGFPPAKVAARRARFEELRADPRTLIFYESAHRITASLDDMVDIFGRDRPGVFARELTKQFETVNSATLGALRDWVLGDPNQRRGEIVVLIHGARATADQEVDAEADRVMQILQSELPPRQAAALAARITGAKKNWLYERSLRQTDRVGSGSDSGEE